MILQQNSVKKIVKLLGVEIDNKLLFDKHCFVIKKPASQLHTQYADYKTKKKRVLVKKDHFCKFHI